MLQPQKKYILNWLKKLVRALFVQQRYNNLLTFTLYANYFL